MKTWIAKWARLGMVAWLGGIGGIVSSPAQAACADMWQWLNLGCRHVVDTFNNGTNGMLVSGYAYHVPWSWTAERRAEENTDSWGGGWSRSVEHPDGDTETVYFLAFSDSHSEVEYNLGYAWATYWGSREYPQVGLGYTVAIVQRPDIASGWPVPVILPLFNARWGPATLMSTYIPKLNGGVNHGAVLYIFGQLDFK